MYFVNSLTGFVAGSSGKILKTTNKGDNWILLPTPTSTALNGIYFVNENTGYVGGANVFLKTTDAGNTWVNKIGLFIHPFEIAEAVYFSDANTGYYCTNTSNCRIVKTTNGGDNWTLIYSNEGIGAGWDMSFTSAMTGYVCTGAGKVLKTTDGGSTWGIQNTPLTENLYAMHFPSVDTGYIASWSGKILKTTNGGLTYISKNENEIASEYTLEQNFPNPFNPSTTISFSIAKASDVILTVYDISGKEIVVLVNRRFEPGNYEVAWNAADYNSGVYLYRLTAGTYTETKKMLLIK